MQCYFKERKKERKKYNLRFVDEVKLPKEVNIFSNAIYDAITSNINLEWEYIMAINIFENGCRDLNSQAHNLCVLFSD